MDDKTTGIIATVVSVLLCGCPGIFLCLFGGISALGGGTFSLGQRTGNVPIILGIFLIGLGLLLALIPVVVGLLTLRKKPPKVSDEPLPPAS